MVKQFEQSSGQKIQMLSAAHRESGWEGLRPRPADLRQRQGYTRDMQAVHHQVSLENSKGYYFVCTIIWIFWKYLFENTFI